MLPAPQQGHLLQCPPWQGTGPVGTSGAEPVELVHYGDIRDGWKEVKKPTCFVMVVQAFPSLHPSSSPLVVFCKIYCIVWDVADLQ